MEVCHSLEKPPKFRVKTRFLRLISLILFLLGSCFYLKAQRDSLFGQVEFLSFISQNDLYQPAPTLKSDKDFTNGLSITYGGGVLKKMGGSLIGIELRQSSQEYSLGLAQEMFTPEDIQNPEVDSTDRPYSGLLYLAFTANSNQLLKGRKLVSKLSLGVQGPAAQAKETQSWVHGFTNNYIPAGWDNQIGNGLLLDYELIYQHLVSPQFTYWESSLQAKGHIGTVRNYFEASTVNRIGWFNSSFANFGGLRRKDQDDMEISVKRDGKRGRNVYVNRKWQAYLIADAYITFVLYDGTVSGSLIPFQDSPYLLDANDITHFSGGTRLGADVSYGSVQLQYVWRITGYRVHGTNLVGWGQFRLVVSL